MIAARLFAPILAIGLSPIVICFFLVILITSSDKSYGFRRLFVKLLLSLFEWASQLQNEEDQYNSHYDERDVGISAGDRKKGQRKPSQPPLPLDKRDGFAKNFTRSSSNGQIMGPAGLRDNGAVCGPMRPNKNSFTRSFLIEKGAATVGPNTPIPYQKPEPEPKGDAFDNGVVDGGISFGIDKTLTQPDRPRPEPSALANFAGPDHVDSSLSPASARRHRASIQLIKEDFQVYHVLDYIKFGMEAIIEDEVTQRFQAEELPSWNLLTRTNKNFYYISPTFTIIWGIGFIFRYVFLLPIRVLLFTLGIVWLMFSSSIIGMVPNSNFKIMLYRHASLMCFRILARSLTAIVTFHNKNNRAQPGGICVANHTSPIDVVMLSCDNCYAMVGQRHGGFFGFLQRILSRSTSHVWFERSETQDRRAVFDKMKEHVSDPRKLPILIFPEGTCINNTSVMMFKKGTFEVGGLVYPAAIKYDARFGDPFWDSSRQTFLQYLLMMMTSWALVCDIWYLPPMTMQENENAYHFADRVKSAIAYQGGLVDLDWDGELKRAKVKESWKVNQQYMYSQRIKTD